MELLNKLKMNPFEEAIKFLNEPTSKMASDRLSICKGCPELSSWNICNKCGCVMPVKVRIPGMKCPIGKW